jgi:hypothetical protein
LNTDQLRIVQYWRMKLLALCDGECHRIGIHSHFEILCLQPIGSGSGNLANQGTRPMSGLPDPGLGPDRALESARNGPFQNQQGIGGGSGFSQGRPGTPGTPQGGRPVSQTLTPTVHQQAAIGTYSRPQSGGQSRPEVVNFYPKSLS